MDKFSQMDYETYKKFSEMRESSEISGRKVKTRYKLNPKKFARFVGISLLTVALSLAIGYGATKTKMQGIQTNPRTGFTYGGDTNYNPTFDEVVKEMFDLGKGR